jgi:hypothetical protein
VGGWTRGLGGGGGGFFNGERTGGAQEHTTVESVSRSAVARINPLSTDMKSVQRVC